MFNSSSELPLWNESPESVEDSTPLSNARLAAGLERIAELLTEGPRPRREGLRRAAAVIRWAAHPVARTVEQNGVEGVHQLGLDYELAGLVTDWVRSGHLPWLERLENRRQKELSEVPGIGPKLARELAQLLGVVDLAGLARALREGQLDRVCGFGPKRVKMIETFIGARAAAGASMP
jgi:DNA polymerase (family 10)